MLTAVPKRWFSWDFTVMDGTQAVGDIDLSCWREKGVITIQGADYRVYRDGFMSGAWGRAFALLDRERVVGTLSPRGPFTRRAAIDLPVAMPLSVRVFIIWLAVIIWKREAEAQGATAGT